METETLMAIGRPRQGNTRQLRVRVTDEAKRALENMAPSPRKQGEFLSGLLLAAQREYGRLESDPAGPPGIAVSATLMRAIEDKRDHELRAS